MKKQIVLNETELKNFIENQARMVVNEMKNKSLYNIVKKSVNETFDLDNKYLVQHPVDVNAEGVFDFEPDEMNINALDRWDKDNTYWEDYDLAAMAEKDPQFENKLRECIKEVIKETLKK